MLSKEIHSTSVVMDDNGILITGDSGSGKSDLALRLIDNGATLISDDITICKKKIDHILLYCPNKTKGLLEVREVGIITVPFVEKIKLRMIVKLMKNKLKRFPTKKFCKFLGFNIPLLIIDGHNPSSVIKVKVMLNEINEKI